jgi:Leucine-rich repeat (LRR) protein
MLASRRRVDECSAVDVSWLGVVHPPAQAHGLAVALADGDGGAADPRMLVAGVPFDVVFPPLHRGGQSSSLAVARVLLCDGNAIGRVPSVLAEATALRHLSLAQCGITTAVADTLMRAWSQLRVLDLSMNRLSHFDVPPGCLPRLRSLNLRRNRLARVAASVCSLPQLQWLDVRDNHWDAVWVQRLDAASAAVSGDATASRPQSSVDAGASSSVHGHGGHAVPGGVDGAAATSADAWHPSLGIADAAVQAAVSAAVRDVVQDMVSASASVGVPLACLDLRDVPEAAAAVRDAVEAVVRDIVQGVADGKPEQHQQQRGRHADPPPPTFSPIRSVAAYGVHAPCAMLDAAVVVGDTLVRLRRAVADAEGTREGVGDGGTTSPLSTSPTRTTLAVLSDAVARVYTQRLKVLRVQRQSLSDADVASIASTSLSSVTWMDLSDNKLTYVPSVLAACVSLTRLSLKGNGIGGRSATIHALEDLMSVDVDGGASALSARVADGDGDGDGDDDGVGALAQLHRLRSVDLSRNQLSRFPLPLFRAADDGTPPRHLTLVDLSHNCIRRLPRTVTPEVLRALPLLQSVFMHGNPVCARGDGGTSTSLWRDGTGTAGGVLTRSDDERRAAEAAVVGRGGGAGGSVASMDGGSAVATAVPTASVLGSRTDDGDDGGGDDDDGDADPAHEAFEALSRMLLQSGESFGDVQYDADAEANEDDDDDNDDNNSAVAA